MASGKKTEARTCPYCRKAIYGRRNKRFCDDDCRTRHHNERKAESRKLAIAANEGRCYYPDCTERALYFHKERGVALCGVHHAALQSHKRERSGKAGAGIAGVLLGGYYGGYYHVSIYDEAIQGELSGPDYIGRLIDHLSGELDECGVPIGHPLDWDEDEGAYCLANATVLKTV